MSCIVYVMKQTLCDDWYTNQTFNGRQKHYWFYFHLFSLFLFLSFECVGNVHTPFQTIRNHTSRSDMMCLFLAAITMCWLFYRIFRRIWAFKCLALVAMVVSIFICNLVMHIWWFHLLHAGAVYGPLFICCAENSTLENWKPSHKYYRNIRLETIVIGHCFMQINSMWSRTNDKDSFLFKMIKCSSFSIKNSCWNHIS